MFSAVLVFIILLIAIYLWGSKNYDHFSKCDVKNPKTLPFLGNMWPVVLMRKHLLTLLQFGYDDNPNEKYVGFFSFKRPEIWLKDTELIKQICIKDFESFIDHPAIINEDVDNLYSQLIVCLRGKRWKEMRSIMSPAFTTSKIKGMMPLIIECTQQLITYLKQEINRLDKKDDLIEIEAKDMFSRYANDIIASVAFGHRINSHTDRNNKFFKSGVKLTDTDFIFWLKFALHAFFPSIVKFFGLSLIHKPTGEYFKNIVMETMRMREEKGIQRNDMIHLLMMARKGTLQGSETHTTPEDSHDLEYQHATKTNWTDDELTAQAMSFYIASFESTSTFLSFATYRLAMHQDVQRRLLEEVDATNHQVDMDDLYENIHSMKYMDMFISECLRLYPTLPIMDRECKKTYVLPPPNNQTTKTYQIRPKDIVVIPVRSIQRDPQNFDNPLEFDPERFSEENRKKIKPFTYIPFGVGPRQCIGRRFAMIELKCILYFLLLEFTFHPCSKTKDPANQSTKMVSVIPKEGIWVGIKDRRIGASTSSQ